MNDPQLLSEGRFIDGAILLVLTARLFKPFKSWDAYKLGIIDKNGVKIRDPETSKEKDAWSLLNRLLAKIKRMFVKHKLIGSLLTFYVLLKEDASIQDDSVEMLVENKVRASRAQDLELKLRNEILNEGFTEDEYYTLVTNLRVKRWVENGREDIS